MQIFFAGGTHGSFHLRCDRFGLAFINFDNDFVVDDVHDFAGRAAQFVV